MASGEARVITPEDREHQQREQDRLSEAAHAHAERIRHEIDLTRGRMDQTLDELQLRLSPRYLTQQAMDTIKDTSRRSGGRIRHAIQDHPVPAMLAGVGLSWLIGASMRDRASRSQQPMAVDRQRPAGTDEAELRARQRLYEAGLEQQGSAYSGYGAPTRSAPGEGATERARERAGEMSQQVSEQASQWRDRAAETAEHGRERASEFAHQMRDQASDLGHQMRERAGHMGERFRGSSTQAQNTVRETFDAHPLAVGLSVFAAGLLGGLMMPATRKEDQWMGETRDELFDQAREYGSDLMHRGQAVADRAMEAAQQEAEKQGVAPEDLQERAQDEGADLKERAQAVAGETAEAAKDEAEQQGLKESESEQGREQEENRERP